MQKPRLDGSIALAAAITATLYLPTAAAWAQENVIQDIVIKGVDGDGVFVVADEGSQYENLDVDALALTSRDKYWIGVKLVSLSDALRAQLDLPEKVGVVVGVVFPNSPAEEAGIQQYDIVLGSGDHPIREGAQMVALVAKAKDAELPLTVFRQGKPIELTVTPTKRPGVTFYVPGLKNDDNADNHHFDFKLGPLREYRIVRPGVVLHNRVQAERRFPDGMRLRIELEDGKPDRLTIDRGDDHWELTDKQQLDDLPDDVRPHVERYLGEPIHTRKFSFDVPLKGELSLLHSERRDGDESEDFDFEIDEGEVLWQELEEDGPLSLQFDLDRVMEQIDSIRKQFEQLAEEQAERTEDLIEEKGEELEQSLGDRVTRLEEMLTQRADQLREMIQSFFGDHAEGELKLEFDGDKDEDAPEEVEEESAADDEVDFEFQLDLESGDDAV